MIKVSQYLFDFNFLIRHKIDKFNIILDTLFKFQVDVFITNKLNILELLYDHSIKLRETNYVTNTSTISIYYVTLIEIVNEFKVRLK